MHERNQNANKIKFYSSFFSSLFLFGLASLFYVHILKNVNRAQNCGKPEGRRKCHKFTASVQIFVAGN